MLKNPSKDGYCLDDGGGNTASASKYTIRRCSAKSEDQHFEVLSQATLAAEQQKVLNAVASGAKFLLRVAGKTGMCVYGPSASIAATPLLLAKCNKQSKNQIFTYDASTKRIRSAEKVNYCVDDGGVKKAGKADTRLAPCDTSKTNRSTTIAPRCNLLSRIRRICVWMTGVGYCSLPRDSY
ncbi:Ricin-type beta-trefoil lectin domain [Phytophthora infestans]|uniref:Ricin-type beta-trefoil lectin domain n=1 Tax=Phytophthora infestans TaxID=4787 RepID=A0A8S9TTJ9_PHYIN|nr:Ricin-type beta-trefoil lectin domain [Phytophthora infestans]